MGGDQLPIPGQLLHQRLVSDELGYIYIIALVVSERGDGGESVMYDYPFLHQFANFSRAIHEYDDRPFIWEADLRLSCPRTSPTARAASPTEHCNGESASQTPQVCSQPPAQCQPNVALMHSLTHTHHLIYNPSTPKK